MRFITTLIAERSVAVATARSYFGDASGWHRKTQGVGFCAGMKLERLPAMVQGLKATFGEADRKLRRGVSPEMLQQGMDLCLPTNTLEGASARALLACSLQGLLRGIEPTCKSKKTWKSKTCWSPRPVPDVKREGSVREGPMLRRASPVVGTCYSPLVPVPSYDPRFGTVGCFPLCTFIPSFLLG